MAFETAFEMWADWIPLAGAAFGIMTVLITLVYMLSEMLMNDRMKGWAKMELYEIFYSAVILSIGVLAIPMIDGVVQGALGVDAGGTGGPPGPTGSTTSAWVFVEGAGGAKSWQMLDICGTAIAGPANSVYHKVDSCHIRLAIWYLREVFDEAKTFAFDIYLSYIKTSMISEFTINIEFLFEKAGFFTFTPWKGFFTMGNTVKALVFDWAIKLMMITKFQEVLLRFIATSLFPALFVIGTILRTFTFTRRLGGLLLGMAIALYFIFPAFYSFGAIVMLSVKNNPLVQEAWLNSPANERGVSNPNPPIANTMYLTGDFAMVGGDGNFSVSEAKKSLYGFEGLSAEQYYDVLEKREQESTIKQDFSAEDTLSDPEKKAAYEKAYAKAETWFNNVSAEDKYDKFVNFAWEPNGPIESLSRLTFWSVFFSLFGIIGTIAGVRSLSITFGGDIEIAGLTRLI